jgi:hypothetical protein
MARSAFWPRLSMSTGPNGFTRRVGSDQFLLDQAESQMAARPSSASSTNDLLSAEPAHGPVGLLAVRVDGRDARGDPGQNRQFPWNFHNGAGVHVVGVSIPVFQGLNRQHQLERRTPTRKRRGIACGARSSGSGRTCWRRWALRAAYRAVQLEERNRELADDQLRLAQERYRVGVASFIELMEAETMKARADRSHLLGVYAFQEALTALEAAVGQELAIPELSGTNDSANEDRRSAVAPWSWSRAPGSRA